MTETYRFEPTRSELRERLDERGEDIDQIDHEDDYDEGDWDMHGDGYPEKENQQML